jgi:hypothetical protein
MKKITLIALVSMMAVGCTKMDIPEPIVNKVPNELAINTVSGLKLETPFVTSQVAMNVKSEVAQVVTIKIFDISNRVVSKSTSDVKAGDNVLKVYTNALPSSAYRIGLFDVNGNQLGITDFNKL